MPDKDMTEYRLNELERNIETIKGDVRDIKDNHLSKIEKGMAAQKVKHTNNEGNINEIKENQRWQTRFLLATTIGIVVNIFLTFR